jgi:putative heme-binding domain-containing protein
MRAFPFVFLALGVCAAQHGRDQLGNPFNAAADIEAGRLLYRANCAVCHGIDGSGGRGSDLTKGVFRRGSSDEALFKTIVKGIPGTEMPPVVMEGRQTWQMIAFLRTLSERRTGGGPGDPGRGRGIVQGKGGCLQCHRIHDQGLRAGPDLTSIGQNSSLNQLEASVVRPNERVKPEHWTIRAVTRDGRRITGRRLNEDTFSVQLIDQDERLVSLAKLSLAQYEIQTNSSMPSYQDKLSRAELDDVIAYLATLK